MSGGRLALVLHTHMPYVEGFGTWPFGEEWLFEAAATVYLPLLGLLEERGAPAPLTLSVTPVLADQLAAPGVHERLLSFLRELRVTTHALDAEGCRASGEPALGDAVERAGDDYARAADALEAMGDGGLARGLMDHAAWTSSATHAVLPLVATDAGVRLQLRAGIEGHRARRGGAWGGGLWLPECAHAPWLHPLLEEAGVHATCVDLTDALHDTAVVAAPEQLPATSWGTPRTLWTWDGPQVAELAFAARAAELRTVAAGVRSGADARAVRELLALQSSDWTFLVTRDISGPYQAAGPVCSGGNSNDVT